MKTRTYLLSTLILLMTTFSALKAQDENKDEIKTLLGGVHSHGGYGGVCVRYTELMNQDGMQIGGRGAWIINHNFALGAGGMGFFNEAHKPKLSQDITDLLPPDDYLLTKDYVLGGGYGGLIFEPIIGAKYPIHISLPILVGAGGVGYTRKQYDDNYTKPVDEEINPEDLVEDGAAFFVIEPGVEVELNLVKYVRVAFGAYYRFTTDINLETDITITNTDNTTTSIMKPLCDKDVLRTFSFGVTFKFGKF